jgi:hypothetical protein
MRSSSCLPTIRTHDSLAAGLVSAAFLASPALSCCGWRTRTDSVSPRTLSIQTTDVRVRIGDVPPPKNRALLAVLPEPLDARGPTRAAPPRLRLAS